MKDRPEKCLEKWGGKTIRIHRGIDGFSLITLNNSVTPKNPIISMREQREIITALILKTGEDQIKI